jgi:adenine-specific DNA-methyltransferase
MSIEKVNKSLRIDLKVRLKEIFPEVFEDNKVNFDKLKALLSGEIIEKEDDRFYFNWAGKSNLFKLIQAPAYGTLKPDKEKSIDFDKTENIVIVGENLETLKLLLKPYFGKVKMIYIDPPYNTGKDFIYRDNFTQPLKDYLEKTGQIDSEGKKLTTNTEASGRYHSDWLNFMYPRLFLAKSLLRDDGVIFVSIDDNEVHHLRMIMDEIFGEENFVITITVNRPSEIASDNVVSKSEYIIVYAKNIQYFKVDGVEKYTISRGTVGNPEQTMPIIEFPIGIKCYNLQDGIYKETRKVSGSRENVENLDPIIIENGKLAKPVRLKARWRSSNDMREFFKNNFKPTLAKISGIIEEIYFEDDRFIPQIKKRTYKKIPSLLLGNKKGSDDLKKLGLYESIEFPKSIVLLKEIISYFKFNDANLILDFFAGSGTTGHAVWDLNKEDGGNRKFILVQLDEEVQDEEIKKEYPTVADICIERLRRVSEKYKKENEGKLVNNNQDFGFKVFKLDKSNFNLKDEFEFDPSEDKEELKKKYLEWLGMWVNQPLVSGWKEIDVIYEVMLKEGLNLNSKIEKVKIKDDEFYYVKDEIQNLEFYISLKDRFSQDTIEEIRTSKYKGKMFVFLDNALTDSDKINLSAFVRLKVI